MLKLTKNQLKVGQKIEFDKIAHLSNGRFMTDEELLKQRERESKNIKSDYKRSVQGTFEPGDTIQIISKVSRSSEVTLKFDDGVHNFDFYAYWSGLKKFTTLGSNINLGLV